MADSNPYVVLGIRQDATAEEIRSAFRRAVRQRHPDTSPAATDDTAVRNIIGAYRVLADPDTRAGYDAAHPTPEDKEGRRRGVRVGYSSSAPGTDRSSRVPCPICRGAGVVQTITTCPTCHGRAEITSLEATRARVVRCTTCRGFGRIRSRETCRLCRGTGTTSDYG